MPAWLNLYLLPRCILPEKCPKIERAARAHARRSYIYTFRGSHVSLGCTLRQMHGRQAADAHKLGLKTAALSHLNRSSLVNDAEREK